jgi:hypothetical protein
MTEGELRQVITRTVEAGLAEQQGDRWVFHLLWKRAIGLETRQVVSRVVLQTGGKLITAYPIALEQAPAVVAGMTAAAEGTVLGGVLGRVAGALGRILGAVFAIALTPNTAY